MKKEYWIVIFTQVIYVLIALFIAIILWKVLPKVNEAVFSIGPFRGGGAFAGFAFVWWFLHKTGPIKSAKRVVDLSSRLPVQATVVYPPTEKNRYNRLFDNFSDCDFYAFNPPFQVEHATKKILKESLKTHKKRYESNVSSHYLFFDKESYENASHFFDELAKQIGQEKVDKDIERIYWVNAPEVPGYTFFIGKKQGKAAIVLYPRAVMENGIPRAVIYIEGAEELHSILHVFFLKQWNVAKHSANNTLQPTAKSGG